MASARIIISLFVVAVLSQPAYSQQTFNLTFSDEVNNALYVYETQTLALNVTIMLPVNGGVISVKSSDTARFRIINDTDFTIPGDADFPFMFVVLIRGKLVAVEDLEFTYLEDGASEPQDAGKHVIKVLRLPSYLDPIFTFTLLIWLVISYITMGSKMDLRVVWSKLKPPWGVLIGMFCQFIVMPALAFGLAFAFDLDNSTAIGLIFDGTCPGGWLSNIFSLLLECDIVLSITMTFLSTILALGMMPLNLFIYATIFIDGDDSLQTPFGDLCIQLATILVPVGLGIILVYKVPKFKDVCEKLLKPIASLIIILALGLGIPATSYVFLSSWEVWAVSALFPILGTILGGTIAKMFCMETRSAITVALETGAQNSLLAKTMVDLFYPKPEADLVAAVPLLISLLSLMEGVVITLVYYLISRFCCKKKEDEEEAEIVSKKDGAKYGEKNDIASEAHVNPTFAADANI